MDAVIEAAIDRYRHLFGWSASEREAFAHHLNTPAPPAIRLQRKTLREQLPFHLQPVPWHTDAFWWREPFRPGATRHFAAGDYYIQDAGSTLAISLLEIADNEIVADLCASPGGKATAILDRLGPDGFLLVNEPIRKRVGALQLNLARQGSPRFVLTSTDISKLATLVGVFDALLLDVPCSGQSLWARQRQTTTAFHPSTIHLCAAREARILREAARLVRPGGRLVYSTCTFAPEENEDCIIAFLTNGDWEIEPQPHLEPWQSPLLPGSYRLWPHRDRCAGAFAVRLRRKAVRSPDRQPSPTIPAGRAGGGNALEPLGLASCGLLVSPDVWESGDAVFATCSNRPPILEKTSWRGPEIAHRRGRSWFPSHALALRDDPRWTPHQTLELDEAQSARYLRGEELGAVPDGWSVACWHGKSLGWIKGSRNRGKNRLPKTARLAQVIDTEQSKT